MPIDQGNKDSNTLLCSQFPLTSRPKCRSN